MSQLSERCNDHQIVMGMIVRFVIATRQLSENLTVLGKL